MVADCAGVATLTIAHYVNGVALTTTYTVTSDATSKTRKFAGPGYFRTWSIRLTVSGTAAFQLFGFVIYMSRQRSQIGANV
jgi:hypothetical protein